MTLSYSSTREEAAELVRKYDALGDELVGMGLAMTTALGIWGAKQTYELREEFKKKAEKYEKMKADKHYADYILTFIK